MAPPKRILKSKVCIFLEKDGGLSCLVETGEKPCEAHIKKMGGIGVACIQLEATFDKLSSKMIDI